MNDLQARHRRWLDRQMPSVTETEADLDAALVAVHSRRHPPRWALVLAGGVATAVVAFVTMRAFETPEVAPVPVDPAVDWGLRFDLHVAGRPVDTDVRIRIAVRKDSP